MKIRQLIEELKQFDPERVIVMASDGEGNSYSPLAEISEGSYLPDSTWSGEYGLESLTQEDVKNGYSEEDVISGKKAICLHPVN